MLTCGTPRCHTFTDENLNPLSCIAVNLPDRAPHIIVYLHVGVTSPGRQSSFEKGPAKIQIKGDAVL